MECLTHTVEGVYGPGWGEYENREGEELAKWRTWWKENGAAFVAKSAMHKGILEGNFSRDKDLKPENLTMTLAWVADSERVAGKDYIFVIGGVVAYRTLDGLKKHIKELPKGSTLSWAPGCCRIGGEPLLSSEEEMRNFKAFCESCGIAFVLVPSG